MIACPSCAADNPDGARFCNQCGARLAGTPPANATRPGYTPRHLVDRVLKDRSAMVGERKRVTVLFADIKGSTQLAERAGAEVWHGILDRFFGLLADAVHRYEGTINQYTGDGVMALFGAPVAHEDHAQRACHAALDMQAAVRGFADELRMASGLNLTLRVGLNTGEVIVGRIGDDLRMDYTAQGVTVNLAARLENICEPGQVYLSRATAAQVEGAFALRNLGQARVNGLDQAVEVYALDGRGAPGTRLARRLADGAMRFVGRESEFACLQSCMAEAAAGRGRVVAVTGTAGIGKSRLLHEFLASAESRGVSVHRTAASPYARHLPMSAARALFLSRAAPGGGQDAAGIRARLEAEFADRLGERPHAMAFVLEFAGVAQPGALNEAQAAQWREPMMRLLADYLPRAGEPQILLFEDLQYLDPYTLDFARELAAAVAGTPTLLLLSWRSDSAVEGLPRADQTLALGALDTAALRRLAAAWLGEGPGIAPLAARIADRADGNPYFVEEAVIALADTGHLEGSRGAYRLVRTVEQLPIPDSVHALIAARIDRLPTAHKSWLQAASVIGADFEADLLADLDSADPVPALAALEQAGFLSRDGTRRRFAQPLVREVAYHAQLESSRVAMHARLAEAMERRCADQPVQASARSIAEHWALAGEWASAGRWNLHAATWFATRDARITAEQFRSAVQHLDRAPHSDEGRRQRIAARAGLIRLAQLVSIDSAVIERAHVEAQALARECGDPACAAELSLSFGYELLRRGDAGRAADHVEAGVRGCPEAARAALASRFRLAILMTFSSTGRQREGLELANWASGDGWLTGPITADNMLSRAFISGQFAWNGDLPRARADLDSALALAEQDGRSASWMHSLRVELAWFSGDTDGVLAEAQRALEQAQAFGSPYFHAIALRAQGQALNLLGRHHEAIKPLLQAMPLSQRGAGAHAFEPHLLAVLAEACQGSGATDDAIRHADAGVASAQSSGARLLELRAWLARLSLPAGSLTGASAAAAIARARALLREMAAAGAEPRLDECAALHAGDAGIRAALLRRAHDGYARMGAARHAARLRPWLTPTPTPTQDSQLP